MTTCDHCTYRGQSFSVTIDDTDWQSICIDVMHVRSGRASAIAVPPGVDLWDAIIDEMDSLIDARSGARRWYVASCELEYM